MFLGEDLNSWYMKTTGQMENESSLPHKCSCLFPPPYIYFWHMPGWCNSAACPPLHQTYPLFLKAHPHPCRHSACGPFRPITKDTRQHAFFQDIGNPSHWYSAPKHGPCSIVVWPREHSCGSAAAESWEGH